MNFPSPPSGPCDVDDDGRLLHGEPGFASELALDEVLPRP